MKKLQIFEKSNEAEEAKISSRIRPHSVNAERNGITILSANNIENISMRTIVQREANEARDETTDAVQMQRTTVRNRQERQGMVKSRKQD